MKKVLLQQSRGEEIPAKAKEEIQALIPTAGVRGKENVEIELQALHRESIEVLKWKWAMLFRTPEELGRFLSELKESGEKQYKLAIENYSVFGNILFAFLRRQMHFVQYTQLLFELVQALPVAMFHFGQRFTQLIKYVEQDACVYYQITWDHVPRKRRYRKHVKEEDDYSREVKPKKKLKSPSTDSDRAGDMKALKQASNDVLMQFHDINKNLVRLATLIGQLQ